MGYGRRSGTASPLPGSSIKGAGSLPPGRYRAFYEKKQMPAGVRQVFVAMPHGFHEADEYIPLLDDGLEYDVVIGLSEGSMLMRTDGGRYVLADASTKAWQTEAHVDVMQVLAEAASKKLKLATPVIFSVEKNGNVLYQRKRPDESLCVGEASSAGTEPGS